MSEAPHDTIEIVPVDEEELADALVTGDLTPARLPYHYPPCPAGTCPGCDAKAGVEAVHVMHG